MICCKSCYTVHFECFSILSQSFSLSLSLILELCAPVFYPNRTFCSLSLITFGNRAITSACETAGDCGRLWYSLHVSSTIFLVCSGIAKTWLNGDEVWCISFIVASFNFCKFTIRLGDPSFFSMTTILEHQVVGVPTDTGSIISSVTSLSRFNFFSSRYRHVDCCWYHVWEEFYFTPIVWSGWCGHVLNALELKCSFSHCSNSVGWFLLVWIELSLVSSKPVPCAGICKGLVPLFSQSCSVTTMLGNWKAKGPDPLIPFVTSRNWMYCLICGASFDPHSYEQKQDSLDV